MTLKLTLKLADDNDDGGGGWLRGWIVILGARTYLLYVPQSSKWKIPT